MPASTSAALCDVRRVELPRRVLVGTHQDLREFGEDGNERLALWVGEIKDGVALVRGALNPPQRSIQNESGVGYFIGADTLFAVNRFLTEKRLRLIAQIHSHPTEAYHSKTDDEYAIVTADGGFSLVVPDFATGEASLATYAVYRLRHDKWTAVPPAEIQQVFVVV
jgi:Prokaryotic homologs of the JAB domain